MFGLLRCCLLPPWPWFWLKFFQVMLVLYQIRVLLLSGTLAEKSPLSKLSNETMFQVPFFTIPALNGTSSAGEPHLWSKISLGFVVSIFRTWVGLMFGACNMATTHGWKKIQHGYTSASDLLISLLERWAQEDMPGAVASGHLHLRMPRAARMLAYSSNNKSSLRPTMSRLLLSPLSLWKCSRAFKCQWP